MRTFVISDAHGYPELIENALDHGGFEPGRDAFVYAGDLVDRGPDAQGCIDLVERYATEVLMGNHDVAVLLDYVIYPQDPDSPNFRPLFMEKVLGADLKSAWKAATCAEGVLVTHAGVSAVYEQVFREECQADPNRLADYLNRAFLTALRRELETGEYDQWGILGDDGPTWFRPRPYTDLLPLAGVTQVVGHTPPVRGLETVGFYMVDPCVFLGMDDFSRYRYAVIEDSRVRLEDGTLVGGRLSLQHEESAAVLCG